MRVIGKSIESCSSIVACLTTIFVCGFADFDLEAEAQSEIEAVPNDQGRQISGELAKPLEVGTKIRIDSPELRVLRIETSETLKRNTPSWLHKYSVVSETMALPVKPDPAFTVLDYGRALEMALISQEWKGSRIDCEILEDIESEMLHDLTKLKVRVESTGTFAFTLPEKGEFALLAKVKVRMEGDTRARKIVWLESVGNGRSQQIRLSSLNELRAPLDDDNTVPRPKEVKLEGSVFVVTRGGQNIKLGLVPITLLNAEKFDTAVKRWVPSSEEFLADLSKTNMNLAKNIQRSMLVQKGVISAFCEANYICADILEPLSKSKTDADGRFSFRVPSEGRFVLVAKAQRTILDDEENYYWFLSIELKGEDKQVMLSNDNLATANSPESAVRIPRLTPVQTRP